MSALSRALLVSTPFLLAAVAVVSVVLAGGAPRVGASSESGALVDRPIEDFRGELLELAFRAASALPIEPHLKNRSRAQEDVLDASLELGQLRSAADLATQIANWRRGTFYADLAYHCAVHGPASEVERYLDLADKVATSADSRITQDWQTDRIRAKIARAHVWLGRAQEAAPYENGIGDAERIEIAAARARRAEADPYAETLAYLDQAVAIGNFDQVRNALGACAQLFDRFYDDTERRTVLAERIRTSWAKLPPAIRIDLLAEIAGFALAHGDRVQARELVDATRAIADAAEWTPRFEVPLMARLAGLRFSAGDEQPARAALDAALALYDSKRADIAEIDRAAVLRSVAEAYQTMGASSRALAVYARAVAEGADNPNGRPRAEDLAATCTSIAVHGPEPDAALWERIRAVEKGLCEPW